MALYRKYRPSSFAEVVGQSHVTEPLSVALDSGRINHAYLFSGPRGCGKTSSARILARSLNCVEGPTSTPCGVCDSCVALAPGGAGHIDVLEMDAATHNGVDDMRELRESAYFAPAESRYRVIILDEAHMITTQAFNALLKIVEEPPEHLIFIFATTEPEKLLTTIRSRTHNYPFRLLTPPDMRGLLKRVMEGEGVPVEDAVYPLVIRAGGGSPRDSLSIMDQLLAGSGPEGVTYQRALGLLGVTDVSLIDNAVDALAAQDQAGLFTVVDDVIEAGYDPRRFTEDLLDRFRDLMILQAVPDALSRGLVNVPGESHEILAAQAEALGQATLTRCAALVNESLAQMKGATAPRLLLEILCARMALPGAGMTVEALAQRVEALESGAPRAVGAGGAGAGGAGGAAAGAVATGSARRYERPSKRRAAEAAAAAAAVEAEAKNAEAQGSAPTAQSAPQEQPAQEASAHAVSAAEVASAEEQAVAEGKAPEAPVAPEDAKVAEARRAREIMDRNRRPQKSAPEGREETIESSTVEAPIGENNSEEFAEVPTQSSSSSASWDDMLVALKRSNLDVWIAARTAVARTEQPTAGELHVDHSTLALARFISTPHAADAFAEAFAQVGGQALKVVSFVGGNRVEGAAQHQAHTPMQSQGQGTSPGKAEQATEPAAQIESHSAPEMSDCGSESLDQSPAEPEPEDSTPEDSAPESSAPESSAPQDSAPAPRPSSALERAKAMAASHDRRPAQQAQAYQPQAQPQQEEEPQSGWRARMKKVQEKAEYNRANGFNGVPLPDEPPADPDYDDAGAAGGYTPPAGGFSNNGPRRFPSQGFGNNPQGQPAAVAAGDTQPHMSEDELREQEQNQLLEDLDNSTGQADHRRPIEVVSEMIETYLGGERVN